MFYLTKVWSNDRIPSCIHRVQISENETRTKYSFGLFTFYDKTISVPEELVDEEHPLRYKPLNIFEYLKANVGHGGELSIKAYCGIWTLPIQIKKCVQWISQLMHFVWWLVAWFIQISKGMGSPIQVIVSI